MSNLNGWKTVFKCSWFLLTPINEIVGSKGGQLLKKKFQVLT